MAISTDRTPPAHPALPANSSAVTPGTTERGEDKFLPRRRPRISPLIRPIFAVNLVALGLLGFGLLFLDDYEKGLVRSEQGSMRTQAIIIAGALGEGAVIGSGFIQALDPESAAALIRRLVEPTNLRARLYRRDGELIADSRVLSGYGSGSVEIEDLPPPVTNNPFRRFVFATYDFIVRLFPQRHTESVDRQVLLRASDFEEVRRAQNGEISERLRRPPDGGLLLTVAVPVQRYRQVVGVLLLSQNGVRIQDGVRAVRLDILRVFGISMGVTLLLSLYLAGRIARPLRRLAAAADRVRAGHGRLDEPIPDLTQRGDEIGELSGALREMTTALWRRMDAIERFAADVAHEIKNPLTSVRSAMETAARIEDPERVKKLMAIVLDDVQRLDRLISDISDASRIDAELSRAESAPVNIGRMLETLADVYSEILADGLRLQLNVLNSENLDVIGIEGRLVQVLRNLIGNAISFSPPHGIIFLEGRRDGRFVRVQVSDDGPGIPEDKLEKIFERFYSARPEGEKFGTHSGLGLSISKQIIEAHGGRMWAENRRGAEGKICGARFIVRLPTG
ncbi:MAG: stimulus-sensing domain-containing protein [Alphaproteobacteria bacterium]